MKGNIVPMNGGKNLPSLKTKNPESGDWAKKWSCKMALWKREPNGNKRDPNSKAFWDGFDLWESYEPYTRYPGELMRPILKCSLWLDLHLFPCSAGIKIRPWCRLESLLITEASQQNGSFPHPLIF